jgi:hypothetical protein
MRLPQLITAHPPSVHLAEYCRQPARRMLPLTASALAMQPVVGSAKRGRLIEGEAALLLSYKGYDAAVTSMNEMEEGQRWHVLQLQGLQSRKSFRVASCFAIAECFAEQLRRYMGHPDAEVQRVTMPDASSITNIDGARDYHAALQKYDVYASLLGLRYSPEVRGYVADVRQLLRNAVTG